MHDSQNSTAGLGYASPRGQGPLHRRAPSRQRGNESHDYSRDMHGPGMQACVPAYREHYWPDKGVVSPLRGPPEGGGIETKVYPLTRESRERARYTPGREQKTPRGLGRREECEGEGGQARLREGDFEGPRGRNPYTP